MVPRSRPVTDLMSRASTRHSVVATTAIRRAAVQSLIDEIGGSNAPQTEFLFASELVVRGSTAPVRSKAPLPT